MSFADTSELLQEMNITFDTCHEPGVRPGIRKSELVQGTDAIRITVKDVDIHSLQVLSLYLNSSSKCNSSELA
jgi:hypothetical protein